MWHGRCGPDIGDACIVDVRPRWQHSRNHLLHLSLRHSRRHPKNRHRIPGQRYSNILVPISPNNHNHRRGRPNLRPGPESFASLNDHSHCVRYLPSPYHPQRQSWYRPQPLRKNYSSSPLCRSIVSSEQQACESSFRYCNDNSEEGNKPISSSSFPFFYHAIQ